MTRTLWRALMFVLAAAAAAGAGMLLRRRTSGGDWPREETQEALGGRQPLRGNRDSAVFHLEGCRMFTADDLAPAFATREAAVEAGYRPCGVCHP